MQVWYTLPLFLEVQSQRKSLGFPKTFGGKYFFVFVEYFCNRSTKMKTKNLKNRILILATANYRHWLDGYPPLTPNLA